MNENIKKELLLVKDLINDTRKQNELIQRSRDWSKLCICIDTIEDTELAINYYLNLPSFNAFSGGYLFIYGLLQALFIQQDAIGNLYDGIFATEDFVKELLEKSPNLKNIREIRNYSIGHPTNRRGKSFHSIVQHSISKVSFELYSDIYGQKDMFEEINVIQCINLQSEIIAQTLNDIVIKLQEELEMHKQRFKSDVLSDLFKHNRYCIEKLSSCLYTNNVENGKEEYAFKQLEIIEKSFYEFVSKIEQRYGFIIDGVKYLKPKMEYVLTKIKSYESSIGLFSNTEASVLIDILNYYVKELETIAKEVDEEYLN